MKGNLDPDVLRGPHVIAWEVQVFAPNGQEIRCPQIESGSVTLTGRARNRTRGTVTIVDIGGLWDREGLTGASPYGGAVRVDAIIGDETFHVAGGLILEVERTRPGSTLSVSFVDYGSMLEWCKVPGPATFTAGANLMQSVHRCVDIAGPFTAVIVDPGVRTTIPSTFIEQDSHEGALAKICTDANIVVWIDSERRLRVQPEVVLDSIPAVYQLADGDTGTITNEVHALSRDGVPAAVVVTGETPKGGQAPVTGSAYQSTGPARWGGPFGYPRDRENRPVLATKAAADAAARTILSERRRLKRSMDIDAVCHPGLEPGDRIDVHSSGERLAMVLDTTAFRLTPDPMRVGLVEATRVGADSQGRATAQWTRTMERAVP